MREGIELGTYLGPFPGEKHGRKRKVEPKWEQVYKFIVAYKRDHDGNSPTIREIQDECGISSTSVVFYYLNQLEARGLIRRPEPKIGSRYASRIEVIGGRWKKEA